MKSAAIGRRIHFMLADTHVVRALACSAGRRSIRPGDRHHCRDSDRSNGRRCSKRQNHDYGSGQRIRPYCHDQCHGQLHTPPNFPIGHYQVQVEAPASKHYEQNDITLNVNDTVRVDARLQVGTVGQSVTVEANALQVQADTSEVSQTDHQQRYSRILPPTDEQLLQLTALVPGAHPTARLRFPRSAVPEPRHLL